MEQQDLVNVHEGERLTGLKRGTLYKLAREGRLPSYKVLTALRFRRSDLLNLVKKRPLSRTARTSVMKEAK